MADQFILGQHEAALRGITARLDDISEKLEHIEQTLAERRGERRVAVWAASSLAGVAGAAVSLVIRGVFSKHGL